MINKKKFIVLFINIFFFNTITYSASNFVEKKINISSHTLTRLLNYLNGDFYSIEKNNRVFSVTGIYFTVSEDGRYSVISYCNEESINCDLNLQEYKAVYRCKKISRQNCNNLFFERMILVNKKNISSSDINTYFNIFKDPAPISNIFFSDMEIETYKEKNSSHTFD